MKYRTVENPEHVRLRRERRSVVQISEYPFEDLNGNVVVKDRRETFDRRTEGLEVTETTMSQVEFQEYFDKSQQSG